MAVAQAIRLGIDFVVITGRYSEIVNIRSKELGITSVFQGVKNKEEVVEKVLNEKNIKYSESAYIGDDINDLEVMGKVKYSFSPSNGAKEVKSISTFISNYKGGEGAVREIVELILNEKNKWTEIVNNYRGGSQ